MSKTIKLQLLLFFTLSVITAYGQDKPDIKRLQPWANGMLDIHFINTGRGNASFLVFPDGTTMLIDAGDMNAAESEKANFPLKISPALPNDSLRPGQWIEAYIRQVMPQYREPAIDYALITHFHSDHYGNIENSSPSSSNGAYRLSGLTDVGDQIPIKNMLDRGYPDYNYPLDLKKYYQNNLTFTNYLAFVTYQQMKNGMKAARLVAGSDQQIKLKFNQQLYPNFTVRNIKSNNMIWYGEGEKVFSCFTKEQLLEKGKFNENPLSNAIKITYGPFTYYTGGDNTGYGGDRYPGRRDVETPMAKVIGKIEAMTLNHHGNRDATNDAFLKMLSPKIVVEQSWCSDQPGQELAFRLTGKNSAGDSIQVFNTYMQPETKAYLGFWIAQSFKSLEGHILIRVLNGGETYWVYLLDDRSATIKVLKTFGPYIVNKTIKN
jgi:ribonuclease BN (tRNA processing enzyme)